ncbi:hypothetical protein K466DRAFT_508545 [Polyporus arcularius HHB13444]|uniref:Uncharacterized protein n=1 Tax=Polyporus arcularius HHB13444 TaxID=1314778 RepID=A0A5C3PZR3_9APHY|nr:hypothetical protein K466DRAFT_508545 [Polyporus arcularius HHB13444]
MSGAQSPVSPAPQQSKTEPSDGYPEQKHAGAVGYGPEYGKGASTGDKIAGFKEEVKGKLFHKPELVQHGQEMRTGALKKNAMEDDKNNPFQTAKEDSGDSEKNAGAHEEVQAATTAPAGTQKAERQAQGQNDSDVKHIG